MNFFEFPITYSIIIANVLFSLIGLSNFAFLEKSIFWPYRIKRNQEYFRFISSGFIHADYAHLFFNMFTLYFFGRAIESYFSQYGLGGNISYLALYALGMVIADIPSYIKNRDNYNYKSLGASGAVSAVVFACVLFNPWGTIYVFVIPMPFIIYAVLYLVYCVYSARKNAGYINHDAHLWGSLFGLVFTLILITVISPNLLTAVVDELTHPHFGR